MPNYDDLVAHLIAGKKRECQRRIEQAAERDRRSAEFRAELKRKNKTDWGQVLCVHPS